MSALNFNTSNQTFRQLLGNGLSYRVPRFQQDYSWGEQEWEDLWEDILGTLSAGGEPAHYMGYLVLQTSDNKSFDIIDGQQRMTTLSVRLADKLFFTVITVTDELNAFKVFETLNARGVRLSATDLLKNYLFMVVHRSGSHETEVSALEQRWERIVGQLGSESFPDFLRVHWSSRRMLVRQAELFKTIRAEIRDRGAVFELLRAMEEDAEVYAALSRPDDVLWNAEERQDVRVLDIMRVRQPFGFLLAARRRLSREDFGVVLHATVVISMRYNAIGNLSPGEQERVYAQAAARLNRPEPASAAAVLNELRPIYVDDAQFREQFAAKELRTTQTRNKRLVRYILFELERHCGGSAFDPESDRYGIEHVLPENPGGLWIQFSEDQLEDFTYRLGNFALLDAATNRAVGNAEYSAKAAAYRKSEFACTRKLADENAEWTPERIVARQRWMAAQATAIWRVHQFG